MKSFVRQLDHGITDCCPWFFAFLHAVLLSLCSTTVAEQPQERNVELSSGASKQIRDLYRQQKWTDVVPICRLKTSTNTWQIGTIAIESYPSETEIHNLVVNEPDSNPRSHSKSDYAWDESRHCRHGITLDSENTKTTFSTICNGRFFYHEWRENPAGSTEWKGGVKMEAADVELFHWDFGLKGYLLFDDPRYLWSQLRHSGITKQAVLGRFFVLPSDYKRVGTRDFLGHDCEVVSSSAAGKELLFATSTGRLVGRIEFRNSYGDMDDALAAMKLVAGEQIGSARDFNEWRGGLNAADALQAERDYREARFPGAKIKSVTHFEKYKQILGTISIPTSCTQLRIRQVVFGENYETSEKRPSNKLKFEISRTEQKLQSISFDKLDLKEISFSPAYSLGATLEELVLLGSPCQFEINSITTDADLKHMRGQMLKSITRAQTNSKLKE